MKKIVCKTLFLLFVMFAFIYEINASFKCDAEKETIYEIKEAGPAGFDVTLPVCRTKQFTGEYETLYSGDYLTASEAGQQMVDVWYHDVDGKGYSSASVPICNDPKATVKLDGSCSWSVTRKATKIIRNTKCHEKRKCTYETVCDDYELFCPTLYGAFKSPIINIQPECFNKCIKSHKEVVSCEWVVDTSLPCDLPNEDDYYFECNDDRLTLEGEICTAGGSVDFSLPATPVTERHEDMFIERYQHRCDNHPDVLHFGTSCTCDYAYTFNCPLYICPTTIETLPACTPKFQTSDGKTAYCVNPNDPFSSKFSDKASYQVDKTFNVRECTTSYGTIDCGYANILIEGAYHELPDEAIELALRLWAHHTGRSGFHQTGLSYRVGNSCNEYAGYRLYNGKVVNVYKHTYEYITKHFFESVKSVDYLNAKTKGSMFAVVCNKTDMTKLGVTCGDKLPYKYGIALFFNTLLGNKDMQIHLTKLYGGKVSVSPEGAYYRTDPDGSYVEVTFEEYEYEEAFKDYKKGEVIDCNKLEKTDPNYDKIAPYCQTQIEIINSKGEVLDKGHLEECVKGSGCRRRTKLQAICDIEELTKRPVKIRVTTEKTASSYSVRKYISCENASTNQFLFAFSDLIPTGSPRPQIDIEKITDPESVTFKITNYICNGTCLDYSVRKTINDKCDASSEYESIFASSIKDPSLNCILNMNSSFGKELYDYSEHFGVNTNICRIYCSDQVEYYIAGKVKAISGRTFKYDIERKVNSMALSSYPLSSMIKERRTCVSEIYYSNNIPDVNELRKLYGLSEAEVDSISNFTDLYDVLLRKSVSEGGRAENINQIIYDLYNCNLYAKKVFDDNGVTKPKESRSGYLRNNIMTLYGASNNYGLSEMENCKIDTSTGENTCIKEKNIQYSFGANTDGKEVEMKSDARTYNSFSDIVYCTGSNCFKYDNAASDVESYNYPKTGDPDSENRVVGDKRTTYTVSGKLEKWFGRNKIVIPTNDYALFEVVVDVDFYNGSEFEVEADGTVLKKGSKIGNFIALDKYVYPISKIARNECNRIDDEISRCEISQEFETVATFYRKGILDDFSSLVASSKKFTCYVDVIIPMPPIEDKPDPVCTVEPCPRSARYRNVDPANLFPRYESIPSNWNTVEGAKARAQIESTAEELRTTDDLLEYRITLTPTQIKNLEDYNKTAVAYSKEKLVNCKIKDGIIFYDCQSEFLNMLRADTSSATPTYGTIDPKYNDGVSAYTKKNKGM